MGYLGGWITTLVLTLNKGRLEGDIWSLPTPLGKERNFIHTLSSGGKLLRWATIFIDSKWALN
jgi:hypothetical protein